MANKSEQPDDNLELITTTPIRLLIVDDRAPAREGLRALISVIGKSASDQVNPSVVVVGEANDGTQAIKLVTEQHPDVVLMDVRMPGLSGISTTRLMKTIWPDLYIVLISFYGAYRSEAMAAGANMFLLKGCCPEDLLKAILRVRESSVKKTPSVGVVA